MNTGSSVQTLQGTDGEWGIALAVMLRPTPSFISSSEATSLGDTGGSLLCQSWRGPGRARRVQHMAVTPVLGVYWLPVCGSQSGVIGKPDCSHSGLSCDCVFLL